MKCWNLLFALLVAFASWQSPSARAHDARPVAVTITELSADHYQWTLHIPPTVERENLPELVWPEGCEPVVAGGSKQMRCNNALEGKRFSLHFPLFNPSLASFYQLTRLTGGTTKAMLSPTEAYWVVPAPMTPSRVIRDYTLLGVEHIITGYDHLLFVFGLLVIARSAKRILLTITGFTLAHSISLSLSALGFVHVPIPPVEACIALSIVFLAHEISRSEKQSHTYRYPIAVSFSFGLLHGLGFASALGEIGLAENEALLSLLFFNVGVELGQILFIAAVFVLLTLVSLILRAGKKEWEDGKLRIRSDMLASYVIGVPAAYWLIQRLAQF